MPPFPLPPLNSHTKRAVQRGKLKASAELDLHGMRQHEAADAVADFMQYAIDRHYPAIRIITGKGAVLREALPHWLDAPALRQHILSINHATPQEGGTGAFLILLRKKTFTP
jgi:DNA-nicking Smr family endonuclease